MLGVKEVFYGYECPFTWGSDFHRSGDAARLRDSGGAQRGATGAAKPRAALSKAVPRGAAAPGHLLPGRFSGGGGAGTRPAASGGAMPVVVLEPQAEATAQNMKSAGLQSINLRFAEKKKVRDAEREAIGADHAGLGVAELAR